MYWIIGLTIFFLISAILILRSAVRDAAEHMTDDITRMYDETEEHSPENLEIEKILKVVSLRNKLTQMDQEKQKKECIYFDCYQGRNFCCNELVKSNRCIPDCGQRKLEVEPKMKG